MTKMAASLCIADGKESFRPLLAGVSFRCGQSTQESDVVALLDAGCCTLAIKGIMHYSAPVIPSLPQKREYVGVLPTKLGPREIPGVPSAWNFRKSHFLRSVAVRCTLHFRPAVISIEETTLMVLSLCGCGLLAS